MWKVTKCCGCCDLHTGTIIIGICGILFSIGGIITHSAGLNNIEDESLKEQVQIGIGTSYIDVIVNALLIYGTIKESRYFLLPWLVCVAIGLGLFTIVCVIGVFFYPILILALLADVLAWYIWLCVLSYYQELNPTNPPPMAVYTGGTAVPTMAPTIVTYVPQAPAYMGNGPQVV